MAEKRVSVRLAAVGGDKLRAELVSVGKEGDRALGAISGAAGPASRGLTLVESSAGATLQQLEALAARASTAAASLRAAGASTGTLLERIDRVTGAAPAIRRSADDIAAYGSALDDLRARHNPLFGVIRQYRTELAEIRQAHAVGAISAAEMTAAIQRERQAALASIAAIKGRTGALQQMGTASRNMAFQSRMLMFQLNDVFVSLASGMNPLMVFVQQGSQIAQIYGDGQGGVRGALRDTGRMIGGLVTRVPLLTAVVAASGLAIAGMAHEINAASDVAVSFGDVALGVWQTVRDGLAQILKPAIDAIAPWFATAWELVIRGVKIVGNTIINSFHAAFVDIRFLWDALPAMIGAAVTGAANATIGGIEAMINRAVDLLNGLAERVNSVLSKIPGLPEDLRVGTVQPISMGRFENPAAADLAARAADRNARIAEIMASDPLGDFFSAVKIRAVANALDRVEDAAGKAGGTLTKAGKDSADAWEGLREAAKGGIEAVTDALSDYAAKARDIGGDIGEALVGAFQSAENAVAEFVKTGKLNFRDLVTSLIADLAKLAARRFILGPIANALSGALGSVGGIFAKVLHAGGLVGGAAPQRMVPALAFAGAPRMHAGGMAGLRPDEVPAILQRGERVLSRREAQTYGAGGGVAVHIHARDVESFRQSRTQIAADIARAVSLGRRGM